MTGRASLASAIVLWGLLLLRTVPGLAAPTPSAELARATGLVARGEFAAAEKELLALKGGKERLAALLALARLQLLTGRYGDAAATAKTVQGFGKDGKIAAAPVRAEALSRQGKIGEAINVVR